MINQIFTLAQSSAKSSGGMGALMGLFPFIIIGIMIFVMFRAQKKQRKKREEMISSICAGAKIITVGGIIAEVKKVKEESFIVKIAEKVSVEIKKTGVSYILPENAENSESADEKNNKK